MNDLVEHKNCTLDDILSDDYSREYDFLNDHLYQYKPQDKTELIECIRDCIDKDIKNLNIIDVSAITDLSHLFTGIETEGIDIRYWNVSNVVNFNGMCFCSSKFNSDISLWDVSRGEDFTAMFFGCDKFCQDLSNWNMSNARLLNFMFALCYNFNSDLSQWDVQNVENFSHMFAMCRSFTANISNWKIDHTNEKLSYDCIDKMFVDCDNFNYEEICLKNWGFY